MATTESYVNTWREHVRVLSENIGPRGSTTEGERLAASYCQGVLARCGLIPSLETFISARSIYRPHLLAAGALLAAFGIYPLAGAASAAAAAAISALAFFSDLLELSFRDNPLRRVVSKGQSQNVVAVIPPVEEHECDLILMGHLDSHRTPLIFTSQRWLDAYKAFTMIAFVAFALQVILYTAGVAFGWRWIWPASIPGALCAVLLMALCLQADSTPFNAGANDNASSVGLVLTLAQRLQAEPLRHTRVWCAFTGCEEVQHYGAIDFYRRHRRGMRQPAALVFEMLGCAGPAWLMSEGIVVPFHADRDLATLAARLAAGHPEWRAHPARITGGNTEVADAGRNGVKAIAITGMTPEGHAPWWHQAGDTYDKIDPEVLGRAYRFTWAIIEALDGRSSR